MKTVYIIDLDSPQPYNSLTLSEKPTGGTILAIINLAEGLSKYFDVYVIQASSTSSSKCKAHYISQEQINEIPEPNSVITIRVNDKYVTSWSFQAIRRRYPNSKLFHWQHITLHDIKLITRLLKHSEQQRYKRITEKVFDWVNNNISIVGTSRFHEQNIKSMIYKLTGNNYQDVHCIYNPVTQPQYTMSDYNPNKIFYASNPERGLDQAVKIFKQAKKHAPDLQLHVTKPPYDTYHKLKNIKGIVTSGSLPRHELFQHIHESLLVLYPNIRVQECFGYIYAESNALSTPVIAHDHGSAREVLSSQSQIMDCRNLDLVVKTILDWRNGNRPKVYLKEELKVENVVKDWVKLLDS